LGTRIGREGKRVRRERKKEDVSAAVFRGAVYKEVTCDLARGGVGVRGLD